MPCYFPVRGTRTHGGTISFSRPGFVDQAVVVPCGRCVGCRLERSRQWAVRMMHELEVAGRGSFVTLTFAPEHVPASGSVDVRDWQLFAKRLRRSAGPFRFFACGEYGERFQRPHYHAVLFGLDFSADSVVVSGGDFPLRRSALLEAAWPFGRHAIGDVSFESCAYVARYVTKKVTGTLAEGHYGGRAPEFATMSRRPGLGRGWWERFGEACRRDDSVVVRGKECSLPRYYSNLWEREDPRGFARAKAARRKAAALGSGEDDRSERLTARARAVERKLRATVRRLEVG